jgi:kinesin family member 20
LSQSTTHHQSLATMFPHLSERVREEASVSLPSSSRLNYCIWVSFAEVYNENCYDLLDKIPEVKRKGDKPRRTPLKIAEDRSGCVFIRGLKEVLVSNADEAYQLLLIGRENLQVSNL